MPPGHRFGISILGRDFLFEGGEPWPQIYGIDMRGNGIFYHNDSTDRPESIFGGGTTLYSGGTYPSCLLVPIIPAAA